MSSGALIIGSSKAGIQAALDLADSGISVQLITSSPFFSRDHKKDQSSHAINTRLLEVAKHPQITVRTNTKLKRADGKAGAFQIELQQHARFIDLEKCTACGDCIEKCPVHLLSEFDEGLGTRTAIHRQYPQAIPDAMLITKTSRPPCVITCPASVNVQGYVALAAEGKFEEAYKIIKRQNPFPSVCGRVCHHPCESECNRKDLDEAVAINPLKRFISDSRIPNDDSLINYAAFLR